MIENVIVIPTHISGIRFLENLLCSFDGFDKYPILIVINGYKQKELRSFLKIKQRFSKLPIAIITNKANHFAFGGLLAAYVYTNYNNIFLLPHSCEILNTAIFEIVFEKHKNKSVAFALADSSEIKGFWHSEIGKYRRSILDKIDLPNYLPHNMIEVVEKAEVLFTKKYHSLDQDTVVLFPNWLGKNVFEEKFGRVREKISNEYIIKWKTHWNMPMVLKDALKTHPYQCLLYEFKLILKKLFRAHQGKL